MGDRISVVINTLNEEENLPLALASVRPWADEVVVVDMHSEDRTVDIARAHGAKVFLHEPTAVVEPARAYALAQATGDWVLILDADELVPAPLSRRLRDVVAADAADVVVLPRANHLLGAPLRHSGWAPHQDRQPRFFRRGTLHATDAIHAGLIPDPAARILEIPAEPGLAIVHFNYFDTAHFIEKLNRYTTVEAIQASARGARASAARTLLRAARAFLHRYIRQHGFRDGWRGFYLALLWAFYRVAGDAKLREIEAVGSRDDVRARYRAEAERIIAGYTRDAGSAGAHAGRPT